MKGLHGAMPHLVDPRLEVHELRRHRNRRVPDADEQLDVMPQAFAFKWIDEQTT